MAFPGARIPLSPALINKEIKLRHEGSTKAVHILFTQQQIVFLNRRDLLNLDLI